MSGKRTHPGVVCLCEICGVEFHPPWSSVGPGLTLNPGLGKYCSMKCSGIGRRGNRKSLAESLWPRINKNGPIPPHCPELGPCWVWTGRGKDYRGAARIGRVNAVGVRTTMLAYRVAYELEVGPIPPGMFLLHKCDNPSCVRPSHMFVGDAGDNSRDMIAKGRHPYLSDPTRNVRGEKNEHATLTDALVHEIRRRKAAGQKSRQISVELGLGIGAVSHVWFGRSWTHVPDNTTPVLDDPV